MNARHYFYCLEEELEEIKEYAHEHRRTVSNFAVYSMQSEMRKTKKRAENLAEKRKVALGIQEST